GPMQLCNHFREAVQRLRPEHQIDERGALGDRVPLLAGYASTDADENVGTLRLELPPFSKHGEHLLLRLLAHGAGIHEQDVGLRWVVCRCEIDSTQYVPHASGVVLIHLAAKRFDEVARGHRQFWKRQILRPSPGSRTVAANACRIKWLSSSRRLRAPPAPARRIPPNHAEPGPADRPPSERDVVVEVLAPPAATTAFARAG